MTVRFGRYYTASTYTYIIVAMSVSTPGSANAHPRVGSVAVNELVYHPMGGRDVEHIELYKFTNSLVLSYSREGNPRKLRDGIESTFPAATTVPPRGYLLVLGIR